jgi:hypothetical protein
MNHLKRRDVVIIKPSNLASSRRQFLLKALPTGTLFCFGCGGLLATAGGQEKQKPPEKKHKFLEDSSMSFEDVYKFAFKVFYIPLLQNLAPYIKSGNFLEILKSAASDAATKSGQARAKKLPKNDFAAFKASVKESNRFWEHVLTEDIVEDTDKAIEVKITECLWAKTFREANASDIGYATICYPDYASAKASNPKLKMIRTKTLMQGNDCCNHRWVWEG